MLSFSQYQNRALATAHYPHVSEGAHPVALAYCTLKLNGEAGEVAEALGKHYRSEGFVHLHKAQKEAIMDEMGDVLWYLAALASELGVRLETIAAWNLEKLAQRWEQGPEGWLEENK